MDDDIYEKEKPYKGTISRFEPIRLDNLVDFGSRKTKTVLDYLYSEFPELPQDEEIEKPNESPRLPRGQINHTARAKSLNFLPGKTITGLFSDRLDFLRQLIGKINREIEKRRGLETEFLTEIQNELKLLELRLKEVNPFRRMNLSIAQEIMPIQRAITTLREQRRSHRTQAFRDIVWLEKELVELLLEYKELLRFKELIENE